MLFLQLLDQAPSLPFPSSVPWVKFWTRQLLLPKHKKRWQTTVSSYWFFFSRQYSAVNLYMQHSGNNSPVNWCKTLQNHKNLEKNRKDNHSYHDYLQSLMWTKMPSHSNEKIQTLSGQKRDENFTGILLSSSQAIMLQVLLNTTEINSKGK